MCEIWSFYLPGGEDRTHGSKQCMGQTPQGVRLAFSQLGLGKGSELKARS